MTGEGLGEHRTGSECPGDRHDPDGWLYRQELVDCGKGATGRCRKCANGPGHGPYWYAYRWEDGRMHKRYVGRRLPESVSGAQPGSEPARTHPTKRP